MQRGTKVTHIDDPSRVGEVTGRTQQRGPFTYIEVRFPPHELKPIRAEFLQEYRDGETSMEEGIRAGKWGKGEDLRRLLTFEKLKGCLHDFLYSMDAARIDFHEYQFKPVLKFINSPTERLLLADEVGLGKTIEAALIWLEMQARHDARRLLVVCPNMLAQKWRRELRDKFGVAAEVGNAEKLLDALGDFRRRSDSNGFAWICTYSGLRPFRTDLAEDGEERIKRTTRGEFFHQCETWNADEPFFDLAIFDEAHYMRNAASLTSRLGAAISAASRATLLVSATPVNNSNTDLLTLLRLLDPDFFESQPLFDSLLAENRPAVQAANHLGAAPPRLADALNCLNDLVHSSFVGKSPLLPCAKELVASADPKNPRSLLDALQVVDQLNVLGSYVARTRRVQVKEKRPKRTPVIWPVTFCDEEMQFYQAVTTMVRRRIANASEGFSAFHLTLPQQRMASCIPAVIEAVREGTFGSAQEILSESFDSEDQDGDEEETLQVDAEVKKLMRFDFEKADSKYRELIKLLREKFDGEKVIIFAYFKGTLRYLFRRLRADGIGCAIIHGDIPTDERLVEIDRFRDDGSVRVLLSSEVGSEGLDLQFCRVMMNYDLPWNPMRVEQRIGRIDRVGQTADRLSIVHFKVCETIEERLYERLHKKLGIFENSLGDLEAILGEEVQNLTMDLFARQLTPHEEDERIERTRIALENRLRLVRQLEEEGESLIAFSDLIANRIEQSRELGRYVTAEELRRYISDFFVRNYKGCVLEWDSPHDDWFRLELTFAAHERLQDFIRSQRLQVTGEFRGRKIVATLNAQAANGHSNRAQERAIFINHISPLIRWITEENRTQTGAFYKIAALTLRQSGELAPGDYFYRIERWSFAGLRSKQLLSYGFGRVESDRVWIGDEAEEIVARIIREGETWAYPVVKAETVLTVSETVKARMADHFAEVLHEAEAENENLRTIKATQIRSHFRRRRQTDERRLQTARARMRQTHFIRMLEGNLARTDEREGERMHHLERQARLTEDFDEIACGIVRVEESHSQ